jgi:membrane protein YdbS with pleckstrin-like domain
MAFPPKLLNEGEQIVLDLRPHWLFFFEPLLSAVVIVIVAMVLAVIFGGGWVWTVAGVAFLAAAVWAGMRYLKWINMNFVVTTDRVIYRSGLISKQGIQIPLERVNNVIFNQNIWERMVGAGDLVIESAGQEGRQVFEDVRHPDHVQNVIHAEMDKNEDRKFDRIGQVAGGGAPLTSAEQLEKLEGMLQRGTITQAEFDAQKRRLLGEMPPPPPPPRAS